MRSLHVETGIETGIPNNCAVSAQLSFSYIVTYMLFRSYKYSLRFWFLSLPSSTVIADSWSLFQSAPC